ncbi:hypothetical protein GALMADRAFT_27784, partial [Galerina marginata CBS 339.88]
SQNDYLREWVPRRPAHLHTLLSLVAPRDADCSSCKQSPATWRCEMCFGGHMLCATCCCTLHQFLPFHRIKCWNGRHFRAAGLWETGVKLYLGHNGLPCAGGSEEERRPTEGYPPGPPPARNIDDSAEAEPEQFFRAPAYDTNGNRFINIVDTSGIHQLPVVECTCQSSTDAIDIQYLKLGLFPASFQTPKTVFTLNVLNDFRLSSLECKTSGYQYYQKLRRLTCPAFPKTVINRYRELRRVSRQYRNLKLWKMHGRGHDMIGPPPPLFCAACPQPGINLPDDWQNETAKELNAVTLTGDGNFKAYHLKQKNEADDVHLTDGDAFMTARAPYKAHLEEAEKHPEIYKQSRTCNHHNAALNKDQTGPGKRVRGVGCWACGRHGCFAIGSLVDFIKGEKQMSMDWSLCECLKHLQMDGITCVHCIYDIMCQFHVNLVKRITKCTTLSIPDAVTLIGAIGLFHVHGHKEECLYRWATTYVPGAAIVDGEVLETLWSVLNGISRSTVGATTAHRTEILDDHMGDSNWKKIINMAGTIAKRYNRAVVEQRNSQLYYDGITKAAPEDLVPKWREEIEEAELQRPSDVKKMDIMQKNVPKRVTRSYIYSPIILIYDNSIDSMGVAAWLSAGLKTEERQTAVRSQARKCSRVPTTAQKLDLVNKRRQLQKEINTFSKGAYEHLGEDLVDLICQTTVVVLEDEVSDIEDAEAGAPSEPVSEGDPEHQLLPFPSAVTEDQITALSPEERSLVKDLQRAELEIRHGQAEDALDLVRTAVIQLSWHMKNVVRTATGVATRTKAWDSVHILNRAWALQRIVYNHNRAIMRKLVSQEARTNLEARFPYLELKDCSISTQVVAPNSSGQSTRRLPWFWSANRDDTDPADPNDEHHNEFYRINWLSARAQRNRWAEELNLTQHEMGWTVRFYVHMARKWRDRRDKLPSGHLGHRAYAEEQITLWNELSRVADSLF